jgi:hypothetical protein
MTPEEMYLLEQMRNQQMQRDLMPATSGAEQNMAMQAAMAKQGVDRKLAERANFMAARERALQPTQAVGPAPGSKPPNPFLSGLSQLGRRTMDYLGDPEVRARLAAGLQSMTVNPNQAFIQSQMERASDIRGRRQSAQQANITAQYFRQQGQPELAQLIENVPGVGAEALKAMFAKPPSAPSILQEYLFAKTQNPELTYEQFLDMKKSGGTTVTVGGQPVTPGFEALDKAYAKDHLEWVRGGRADMQSQIQNVGEVMSALEQGQPLTGTLLTLAPDFVRAFADPESLDAQQKVEEVVQRSLRVTLGAQFTEKEGDRLIARAYNPQLSPQINARRLRKLYQKLGETAQARNAMADYFDKNGTLQGYKGPEISIADLYTAVSDYTVGEIITDPATGEKYEYLGGDAADEKNYRKIN